MQNNQDIEKIAQEITASYLLDNSINETLQNGDSENRLKEAKKSLRNKTLLWAVTGIVMTVCLAYLGIAWYTRIANTHAITFEVADYELAVNDNTDNEFLVNIYTYQQLKKDSSGKTIVVAPGASGYIPIKLSARHSEIDIEYSITVDSKMLPELREHIRLFYLVDNNKEPVVLNLDDDGKVLSEETWKFMQKADAVPAEFSKVYFPKELTDTTSEECTMSGTVDLSREKLIYLYWEWYYDADDAAQTTDNGFTKKDIMTVDGKEMTWEQYSAAWNELDTDIGKYPKKYWDAMIIHLKCVGAQSELELDTRDVK